MRLRDLLIPGSLLHQLDLIWSPSLVEPRLQRAVETEDHIQAFARDGLRPIVFMTGRDGWCEINVHRGIRIDDDALFLTPNARELPVGLEFRARLIVIDHQRPEVLGRDVRRKMQLISLAAIERSTCLPPVRVSEGALFPSRRSRHSGLAHLYISSKTVDHWLCAAV
jgi:hypothetical protein